MSVMPSFPNSLPQIPIARNELNRLSADDGVQWFVPYLPITTKNNKLKEYIDGEEYFGALCDELLGDDIEEVYLTGLHFMGNFKLKRNGINDEVYTLANVLRSLEKRNIRVYLLVNFFWLSELTESEVKLIQHPERGAGIGPVLLPQVQYVAAPDLESELQIYIEKNSSVVVQLITLPEIKKYFRETCFLFTQFQNSPTIQCRLSVHNGYDWLHSHHQKTIVIKKRFRPSVAYLGGIDLTFIDGDRWDTNNHAYDKIESHRVWRSDAKEYKHWHDVQCRITGEGVDYVLDNFCARWKTEHIYNLHSIPSTEPGKVKLQLGKDSKRTQLPRVYKDESRLIYPQNYNQIPSSLHVQIVRSMPEGMYAHQRPTWNRAGRDGYKTFLNQELDASWEHSCRDAYAIGIRAAQHYVYIENQWITDELIWEELKKAAFRNRKNKNFRIIIMLPRDYLISAGLPRKQTLFVGSRLESVIKASRDIDQTVGMYCLGCTCYTNADQTETLSRNNLCHQIYVHSKVMIIDDCWCLIGSANAGGLSLAGFLFNRPDTELSIIALGSDRARELRRRLWAEHLEIKFDQISDDIVSCAEDFRKKATSNDSHGRLQFSPTYKSVFESLKYRSQKEYIMKYI